jgi:hypothetical protein
VLAGGLLGGDFVRSEAEIRELLGAARIVMGAHIFCDCCDDSVASSLLDLEHTLLWMLGEPMDDGAPPTTPLTFALDPYEVLCVLEATHGDPAVKRAMQGAAS